MATSRPRRSAKTVRTKVLLVDDHPIVRDGLETLINAEEDLIVCGQAADAARAQQLIAQQGPDVVVSDITLEDSDGLDLTKDIKTRYPHLPVIVFSMHHESVYAERALRAGARAYIEKAVLSEKIVDAIRAVLRGDIYVSEQVTKHFLRKMAGGNSNALGGIVECLSNRELEVFRFIGQGLRMSEMARRLHVSPKTIETYRARIKGKLNLADASELLQHAIRWAASQEGA